MPAKPPWGRKAPLAVRYSTFSIGAPLIFQMHDDVGIVRRFEGPEWYKWSTALNERSRPKNRVGISRIRWVRHLHGSWAEVWVGDYWRRCSQAVLGERVRMAFPFGESVTSISTPLPRKGKGEGDPLGVHLESDATSPKKTRR